jgi:hypothetical protein
MVCLNGSGVLGRVLKLDNNIAVNTFISRANNVIVMYALDRTGCHLTPFEQVRFIGQLSIGFLEVALVRAMIGEHPSEIRNWTRQTTFGMHMQRAPY